MQLVNTKILYLLYRQVKLVYARRQKQLKQDTIKRKTADYAQNGHTLGKGLAIVNQVGLSP